MSEKYLSNKKFKKSGNLSLFSIVNVRSMVISLKLALLEERKKKVGIWREEIWESLYNTNAYDQISTKRKRIAYNIELFACTDTASQC